MMTLFKNAKLCLPGGMSLGDLLVGGGKILEIAPAIAPFSQVPLEVVDCSGLILTPGLIDVHVHIAGAGGEGGPATRTGELSLDMMLEAGITTVVGSLGTDGITRSVEGVLMKAKGLKAQGVSAWMLTGSYQVPTPTITGSPERDICLIDEVIGIGEVAISDHRSSCPDTQELIRMAAHARVAGMLSGKAGIVLLHMGDAKEPFQPIYDAVAQSELPVTQFYPTHCTRNQWIFEASKKFGKKGYLDITTSTYPYYKEDEVKPSKALKELLQAGVPVEHITFSSDGCGSLPGFDPETGALTSFSVGHPSANLNELKDAVLLEGIPMEAALKVLTQNPATILKLPGKGVLKIGFDADILVMTPDFEITHLMANGAMMLHP